MARLILQLLAIQLVLLATISALFSKKLKDSNKYQLQQKVLTLGTSYTVKDDHGQDVYKVKF
jgi:hypothetical protein